MLPGVAAALRCPLAGDFNTLRLYDLSVVLSISLCRLPAADQRASPF